MSADPDGKVLKVTLTLDENKIILVNKQTFSLQAILNTNILLTSYHRAVIFKVYIIQGALE